MVKTVAWKGRKAFERRMKNAEKKIRKEMIKQTREAAKVVRREVRRRVRAQFPDSKSNNFTARKVSMSVRARKRNNYRVYGWIGWRYKSQRHNRPALSGQSWHVPMAYTPLLEKGGTVRRKQSRFIGGQTGRRVRDKTGAITSEAQPLRAGRRRRKAHTATYKAKPFLEPAVKSTQAEVYRLIGKTFNVV